jgi:peptide/nickel transport system substrate-binding protein
MFTNNRRLWASVGAAALVVSLAACGGGSSKSGSTSTKGPGLSALKGQPYIVGTTDTVTALDPADSYDFGSSFLQYGIYQTLLTIPPGGKTPTGDAATSCTYTDPKTLKCTLHAGLKFSNGDKLTSSDVKFSLQRNLKIKDPNGASGLLASLDTIDTPSPTTVIFHLKKPDHTFQFVLTHPTSDIVDEQVFPPTKKLADTKVIGSGPYMIAQYKSGQQAVLQANPNYTGPNKAQAKQVFISYYKSPTDLKLAVQNGKIDIAWRTLSPTDLVSLKKSSSVTVATGAGAEIRYWVWKVDGKIGKNKAIRQASAYLIDRNAIVSKAYDNTVKPLYSVVPPGLDGASEAFKTQYGSAPSVSKAKAVLQKAGVQTPVSITIGYTPTHYGPNAVDEANEMQRELQNGGLFKVKIESAEWVQYQTLYKQNAYDFWQLGWFPDFVDADNYLAPFLVDGGFFANGYKSAAVDRLIAAEEGATQQSQRVSDFQKIQALAAKDAPMVPTWVGPATAVYGKGMKGVESTLDPSFIFRFWLITKNA